MGFEGTTEKLLQAYIESIKRALGEASVEFDNYSTEDLDEMRKEGILSDKETAFPITLSDQSGASIVDAILERVKNERYEAEFIQLPFTLDGHIIIKSKPLLN